MKNRFYLSILCQLFLISTSFVFLYGNSQDSNHFKLNYIHYIFDKQADIHPMSSYSKSLLVNNYKDFFPIKSFFSNNIQFLNNTFTLFLSKGNQSLFCKPNGIGIKQNFTTIFHFYFYYNNLKHFNISIAFNPCQLGLQQKVSPSLLQDIHLFFNFKISLVGIFLSSSF